MKYYQHILLSIAGIAETCAFLFINNIGDWSLCTFTIICLWIIWGPLVNKHKWF